MAEAPERNDIRGEEEALTTLRGAFGYAFALWLAKRLERRPINWRWRWGAIPAHRARLEKAIISRAYATIATCWNEATAAPALYATLQAGETGRGAVMISASEARLDKRIQEATRDGGPGAGLCPEIAEEASVDQVPVRW